MNSHFRGCRSPLEPCACDSKRYWLVFGLSVLILGIEIIGGLAGGSLALLSDAGHVFSDTLAVIAAIIVEGAVRRGRSERRLRSIGGYVSAALLFAVALFIIFEAIDRFHQPYEVKSGIVIVAAAFGAVGNFIQHRILESSAARHVTHKGMSWHVLSDLWQSIAVIATGIVIAMTGFVVCDLFISIAIAVVFVVWSFKLLADSVIFAAGGDPS